MSSTPYWIETEDWHTAGEPFRIVNELPAGSLPQLPSVAQCWSDIVNTPDHSADLIRRTLCHEPRGHADMYGGFILPPDDPGAHFGVLFWHKGGFSTACGHGTIALGYWALATGRVKIPDEKEGPATIDVIVDVPSGRVKAEMVIKDGKPIHAHFVNVPSYQIAQSFVVKVPSINEQVKVDVAYSGALYATVEASDFGLSVEPRNVERFIHLAEEIKTALQKGVDTDTYDCYGIIFYEEEAVDTQDPSPPIVQRNVVVFGDGQIDRSPCGSGTCARLAILNAQGRISAGRNKLVHKSIIGSTFEAEIIGSAENRSRRAFPACLPRVRGDARLVGHMKFFIDPTDPIFPGFLLR